MSPIKIGVALGAGSARGWAHIGVLQALEAAGIRPDIISGTSIGALVGAAYADDGLAELERWVRGLNWRTVLGFFDVSFNGGFIKGARLIKFLQESLLDKTIDELPRSFGAVATALETGREVWLREGGVADAVRASIALPGLFTPVERDGLLLVDGGLVNPVPVSLARAMGADFVIAVDLSSSIVGRHVKGAERQDGELPNMLEVVAASINIMQARMALSRLSGEPADVVITPRLSHLALLDYHRAGEAIAEGHAAAEAAIGQIRRLLP